MLYCFDFSAIEQSLRGVIMTGFMPYLVALDSAAEEIAFTGNPDWERVCASYGLFNLNSDEIRYLEERVRELGI